MTDIVERLHEEGLGFGLGPAGLCQEAAEEIERLRHRLIEAEAALWRVYPNTHTVGGNPDPFEGSGETYRDAYHRLREENERLREALGAALEDILNSDDPGAIRIIQVALAERVGDLTEASHSQEDWTHD